MKAALKMLKNFISPAQIKQAASSLIESAIDYKSKIKLNPEEDETEVIAIFYEVSGKIYFSLAIINFDNKILRFEETRLFDELIDEFIKNL